MRIADALGVTHHSGRQRASKPASRIRVTAQLITAADGSHLWSERYDREMTDVFAMQDEIAAAITGGAARQAVGQHGHRSDTCRACPRMTRT